MQVKVVAVARTTPDPAEFKPARPSCSITLSVDRGDRLAEIVGIRRQNNESGSAALVLGK
jgi:hypothetical protein